MCVLLNNIVGGFEPVALHIPSCFRRKQESGQSQRGVCSRALLFLLARRLLQQVLMLRLFLALCWPVIDVSETEYFHTVAIMKQSIILLYGHDIRFIVRNNRHFSSLFNFISLLRVSSSFHIVFPIKDDPHRIVCVKDIDCLICLDL